MHRRTTCSSTTYYSLIDVAATSPVSDELDLRLNRLEQLMSRIPKLSERVEALQKDVMRREPGDRIHALQLPRMKKMMGTIEAWKEEVEDLKDEILSLVF